ncbi:MAG: response regulator [Bacteroidetes bacterium]|nr:response regulator [Bacteroidota bacterium]MCL5737290.1 response regulator [Bacteroidota bacterium]
MNGEKRKILWVDDEIELLKPHVTFLQNKGFQVDTATNGQDAIELVKQKFRDNSYDLILLDEMMAGMGGLSTLEVIKEIAPEIPVVMITKNEAESLMEEAIGQKISDYLTKPVNPSQILLTAKKIMDGHRIEGERVSRDYVTDFRDISAQLDSELDYNGWVDIHQKLTYWELEIDEHPETGLKEPLMDQRRAANAAFGKYIDGVYKGWVNRKTDRPKLSHEVFETYVMPKMSSGRPVVMLVIDCMRLDQWLIMEDFVRDYFSVSKEFYYSILPTATPYSRNAIFSGLMPLEMEKRYPEIWDKGNSDDDSSRNRYEKELLTDLLQRKRIRVEPKYIKIIDPDFGKNIVSNISSFTRVPLTAIVVNFVDILAHSRSDSDILKEIAPDESAYRSLTKSWFQHSYLLDLFKALAETGASVVVTTDHGSVRSMRGSKVLGDREASTNLRYKFGRNLKCDDRQAIFVKNPEDFMLPRRGVTINYIIAKEDFYFVYPTDYHKYLEQYHDSFQHGGISLEEMILPVVFLEPR